jgi:hypothetical protein
MYLAHRFLALARGGLYEECRRPVPRPSVHSRTRINVRAQASQGLYQAGSAQALTFANIEHEGIGTAGVDEGAVQIVS